MFLRDKGYRCEDAIIVHSIDELFHEIEKFDKKRFFVCGIETIYKQLLSYCELALITQIDEEYEADTYLVGWRKTGNGKTVLKNGRKQCRSAIQIC